MTALSGALLTFSAIGNREDLKDKIYNISPTDTPFTAAIETNKATAVTHSWQTDTLDTAASNAQLEGDTFTFATPGLTTLISNTTQILYKTVAVAKTQSAVSTAGRVREMSYQMVKKTKALKRDCEFAMLNNQIPVPQASASSTVARVLRPVNGWMSTNVQRGSGGSAGTTTAAATDAAAANLQALDEQMLKNAVRTAWSSGGEPDMVICGPFNKQRISTFGGNATRQILANDRKLIAHIAYYEHDFGNIKVVPNRFSRDRDCWVLDTNYWAKAILRPMNTIDLAEDSDADKGRILTELTMESRQEAASAAIVDLSTT